MAMDKNTTFGSREVVEFIAVDYASDVPFLNAPWANTTATEITGEAVYAYGGQGHPKRIVFHGEKGGTFTFETQIQTMQLYSFISGAEIKTGANTPDFLFREEIKATGEGETATTLTVGHTIAANSDVKVYPKSDDMGTALTVTGSGTTVTGTFTVGTEYVVYYLGNVGANAQSITLTAKTFPKNFKIYGVTTDKTEDGTEVLMRLVVYKAAPQPNFTINFTNNGDPVSLSITCDLMVDKNGDMLSLIADEASA